jgi:hypothetical protein
MDEFDGYFLWLCELVNADMDNYSELMYELHNTDFYWCIDLDASRASEGLELRKEYCDINKYFNTDWVMLMDKPCSVLEALISLARRMDDMLIEDNTSERVAVWFWEMVKNLGLKKYTNTVIWIGQDDDRYDIQEILRIWMSREFAADGSGSPFPLRYPAHDQCERTLVYQLNDYILENYVEE